MRMLAVRCAGGEDGAASSNAPLLARPEEQEHEPFCVARDPCPNDLCLVCICVHFSPTCECVHFSPNPMCIV